MAISIDSCVVALLGRSNGARQQLRHALEDLGAHVAFEGDLAKARSEQVLDISPNVVIVNLEEGADEALEHLQAVFDSNAINVVFNDAEVSAKLEGWDLARWARHLAAKVLGHDDTLPPRPEGAVRLPEYQAPISSEPGVEAGAASVREDSGAVHAAMTPDIATPAPSLAAAWADETDSSTPEGFEADASRADTEAYALASEVSSIDDEAEAVEVDAADADADAAHFAWDMDALATPDTAQAGIDDAPWNQAQLGDSPDADEIDEADEIADEIAAFDEEDETRAELETAGQEVFDMETFDAAGLGMNESHGQAEAEAPEDEIEFDWQMDADALAQIPSGSDLAATSSATSTATAPDAESDLPMDPDMAALLAQFDQPPEPAPAATTEVAQGLDFSNLERPTEKPPGMPASHQAGHRVEDLDRLMNAANNLSLTAMEEGEAEDGNGMASAPKPEGSAFDFSILGDLSLEPMSDPDSQHESAAGNLSAALDSQPPSDDPFAAQDDPLLAAMGLDETSDSDLSLIPTAGSGGNEIPRVVVLAASIGGPDALRTFLSGLSSDIQAAFLIVQHLESGYFDRLAQQLQKSTALPVKVAAPGMRIGVGEVVVIPASERVTLEADGQLVFNAHDNPPQHSPSIDGVLHDVADRFGRRASAIIFSGMAGDAIDGAAYLTSRGGEVWAQDPSSCVVSSMVDGAIARGIVEFTGSPRELANRCTAMLAG